jgi:hypothetical protein
MELLTRRVYLAEGTTGTGAGWVKYIVCDCDAKFCEAFRQGLQSGGVESVRLPHIVVKLSVTLCPPCVTRVYSKTTIVCVPSFGTVTSAPLPAGVTLSVWLPGTTNALLGLNPLIVILMS